MPDCIGLSFSTARIPSHSKDHSGVQSLKSDHGEIDLYAACAQNIGSGIHASTISEQN